MKHLYLIFLLAFNVAGASNFFVPSATITGGTTVCQGGTAVITFTGSGGTAPYTFTYTDYNGVQQTTPPSVGDIATVSVPTGSVGTFTYTLISVKDNTNTIQNQSGTAIITVIPQFNVTAGTAILICKGNAINLTSTASGNGSHPVSYSWSGPNGYTSNQQSPIILSATASMSGNYTVTATIGSCQVQDVMSVTVLEPTVASAQLQNYDGSEWIVKCTNPGATSGIVFINNGLAANLQSHVTGYSINWGDVGSVPYTTSNASWNINHSYNIGLYTLIISINTDLGCVITKNYTVFVGNQPASPQIQLPASAQGCAPFSLTFPISGVSNNVPGTTYTITFSDDPGNPLNYSQADIPTSILRSFTTTSCGSTFTNGTNTENNAFGVSIRAVNPCGSASSSAGPIRTSSMPTALFTIPPKGCINQTISTNNQSINGSVVTSTQCDAGGGRYWEISPSIGWTLLSGTLGNDGGFPNDFEGWNNGSVNLGIRFNSLGQYTVKLFERNGCSQTSMATQTICIEPPLIPQFTLSTNLGCIPLAVATTNTTSLTDQCSPPTYLWTVTYASGNCGSSSAFSYTAGTSATSASPSFSFTESGTYSIKVAITNSCGTVTSTVQTVVVKKPPTASIAAIPNSCGTASINPNATVNSCAPAASTLTYLWSFPGGIPSSANTANPGTISYPANGNYTVSLIVTNECGASNTATQTFSVNAAPIITNTNLSQTICSGTQTTQVNLTANPAATSFTWTASATTGVTGFTVSDNTSTIPVQTITTTNASAGIVTYHIIPSVGGCQGTPVDYFITVNPSPTVLFSPAPQSLCSGDTSAAVTLSSAATGATFNWSAIQPTGITGVVTTGTNTIPAQVLTNTTSAPITITYNATATTSGSTTCAGALYPYTITVKPKPVITEAFILSTCSGNAFTLTPANSALNAIPAGTTYSWSAPIVNGGMTGGNSGTNQTTITGTLNNPTDIAQTATYTITPTANGCQGIPFTITLMVNPKPLIANTALAICSGDAFTFNPALNSANSIPSGTTYTWTVASNTNVTGQSASIAAGVASISQTLTNSTNTSQQVLYTVTPVSGTCPGAAFTITVAVNPKPVIANATPPGVCSGSIFTFTPANGGANIVPAGTTYTWSNPVSNPGGAVTGGSTEATGQNSITQTLANTTNAPATLTYTVTPNSGNCPGNPFTVTVTVNPIPTTLSLTNQLYCNGIAAPGITFSNLVAGTTYTWTNSNTAIGLAGSGTGNVPPFTPTNTGSAAITGTISVIATFNGCSRPAETFDISVISSPPVVFSLSPQSLCSGNTSAVVTLSSTAAGATFTWSAIQPAGITGVATSGTDTIPAQTLTNTTNAPITVTYNATATTSSGSSCAGANYAYTIIVKPIPSITEVFAAAICSDATFTIVPANSPTNSIPTGTTYSWSAPTVSGGMTGGASGNAQTNISGALENPTNTVQTAIYTITPIGDGCPGNPFTINVSVAPKPTIADVIPPALCSGGTFTVTPANGGANIVPAGTTYTWTVSSNTNITGQSASAAPDTFISQALTNTSNTSQILVYTVTPLSGSCPGAAFTITVTVHPKPVIANVTPPAICSGGTFTVTPANNGSDIVPAGTTYTWSNPISNPAGAITGGSGQGIGQPSISQMLTNTTNDLATLTYTVTPTSGSCPGNPFTVTVTLSPMPLVAPQSATICSTNTFNISPGNSGGNIVPTGTTYTWSMPTISPPGSVTGASAEPVPQNSIGQALVNTTTNPATVIYTVIPTSGSCVGAGFMVTVTVNPAIDPNVTLTNNACFDVDIASIATNITGGIPFSSGNPYQISWSGPNSFASTAPTISNLVPGNYTLTILDAGNCPFTGTYTVTEPADIVITVDNENDISCNGSNDGSIAISVIGGTGNYVYTWTKNTNPYPDVTQDISNLDPGTYVVSVTDANNCGPKTTTFTITEPTPLVTNLASQTNVLCYGAATGAIAVNAVGGTPGTGYGFSWTGPGGFNSTSQNLNGLVAGTYNLTVTDANGCSKNLSVTITQPAQIVIGYTTTPITCYGANNASLSVTLSGGNAPYQYQWSNLATALVQNNLSAGNYTITVTDNSGCIVSQTINIPEAPVFMVNPIISNISCFGAHNGSINLNLTGGIAPVGLTWSDNSTAGLIRNNLGPGTYTATISDGTPCYIVRTYTIIEPQPLTVSANLTNAFGCSTPNSGAIDLVVAGGTPPYVFAWSNGAATEDLNNITSGNYLVNITDANGCTKSAQYAIIRQDPIAITVATQTDFDCAAHTVNQNFVAQVSGGVPPYQLQWSSGTISGANNEIMHSNTNGTVVLTVTDNVGCTATYSVIVDNPVIGYSDFTPTSYGFTSYGIYSIGDPIQFNSTVTGDYVSVSWDFGDGTFSTELSPTHIYVNPRDYVVTQTVTYPFGCVYVQTISLIVEKGYMIVVPTAFTPNNDTLNDTFRPVTRRLKNVHLDVYDTWGSLIYSEIGDVLAGWDGKIKGLNAENGNYYSKVSAETFYGTIVNENHTFVLIK